MRACADLSTRRAFLAAIAILASYNVARGLGAFSRFSDASLLGLLCVFIVLARATGLDRTALGLAREDAGSGVRYGVAAFVITASVLFVVRMVPATTDFLDDSRADVSGTRLLFEIAVPVLLLTVVPEEFIFRGVLLAWGRESWSARGAALASSVLFGLWHISPTLRTMSQNEQFDSTTTNTVSEFLLLAGSVATTFVAGLLFCWLRLRSRSLLAPVIAHLSTNAVALVFAWTVVR